MYRDSTQDLLDGPPDKQGELMKAKAALVASDILEAAYVDLVNSQTSLSLRLDWFKYLTKVADLEPKQNAQVAAVGFSIQIVPPEGFDASSVTIEGVAIKHAVDQEEVPSVDLPFADPTEDPNAVEASLPAIEGEPPKLKAFTVPDFNLTELFGA